MAGVHLHLEGRRRGVGSCRGGGGGGGSGGGGGGDGGSGLARGLRWGESFSSVHVWQKEAQGSHSFASTTSCLTREVVIGCSWGSSRAAADAAAAAMPAGAMAIDAAGSIAAPRARAANMAEEGVRQRAASTAGKCQRL